MITYTIQLATDAEFTDIVIEVSGLTDTNYPYSINNGEKYYWRIKATTDLGDTDWSAVYHFNSAAMEPCIYDLADGDGVLAAVLISCFSDRRIRFQDGDPPFENDRRGWWGDNTLPDPEDLIGSLVWTLAREKNVGQGIIDRATQYFQDCLKWMKDDGAAADTLVTVTPGSGPSELNISITIVQPDTKKLTKYYFTWQLESLLVGVQNVVVS